MPNFGLRHRAVLRALVKKTIPKNLSETNPWNHMELPNNLPTKNLLPQLLIRFRHLRLKLFFLFFFLFGLVPFKFVPSIFSITEQSPTSRIVCRSNQQFIIEVEK